MKNNNYEKVLKLLSYADVDEDFLIDYDTEIQAIVDKMNAYDLLEKALCLSVWGATLSSSQKTAREEYEMFKRTFKREHENNAKDTDN